MIKHASGHEREDSRAANGNFGAGCDISASALVAWVGWIKLGTMKSLTDRTVYRLDGAEIVHRHKRFFLTTHSSLTYPALRATLCCIHFFRLTAASIQLSARVAPSLRPTKRAFSSTRTIRSGGTMQFDASEHPHRRCEFPLAQETGSVSLRQTTL